VTKTFNTSIFRPASAPAANIPLGARSVGHFLVRKGYHLRGGERDFTQIFWCVEGKGFFIVDGVNWEIGPEWTVVYWPAMRHEFYAHSDLWECRWWTLDGDLAIPCAEAFGLLPGVYKSGPAPLGIFAELTGEIVDNTVAGQRQAGVIVYKLLSTAAVFNPVKPANPIIDNALKIIHHDWNLPELKVDELAKRLHLNRSVFSRKFKSVTGKAPEKYLLDLRVKNALLMLRESSQPIREIAYACGWEDPNYFSRYIRQATGHSPRVYRHSDDHPPAGDADGERKFECHRLRRQFEAVRPG
jgi:AraC-like DNA-binding protein